MKKVTLIKWNGPELIDLTEKEINRRLHKACIHLKNEVKKEISTKGNKCGKYEPELSAPDGEPPHLQCGELRRSMAHEVDEAKHVGRVGTNKPYGLYLEVGEHPFLRPTLQNEMDTIAKIIGGEKLPGC